MFDRRSIRYPLIRLIVTTVAAAIGLALVIDAIVMLGNVRRDIERSLTAAASAAATAASAAVVFHDAAAAKEALQVIDGFPEIKAAAIYVNEGYRLASYGDDGLLPPNANALGPAVPDVPPLAASAALHLPIVVDGQPAGTVFVDARLDNYWHTYRTSVATTILVSLSAGALALFLAMRFLGRIIRPVSLLAEAANEARLQQDFTPRPIAAPDNEIGDLVHNFNALLTEVDAGRKSLQAHQDELERLVEERTAELSVAKEEAEEANRGKSRFLAAASHDLRQPIQAISLFEHALGKTPLNEEQRRIAAYLAQATRSLAEILNTLLDVSRFDSGIVQAHPERVAGTALFRDVETEFAPLALAKGLRFKLFFPDREIVLLTDVELLHCVLRNLIGNAIKYTETGGVLVGLRRRGGDAIIQVWDTGIGIAPEHVEVIFDEYFQVGNPERDRTKGLGLGLAIARRSVRILGGRLTCRSRPGKGSLFEVSIPLAGETDQPAGPTSSREADAASAAGKVAGIRVVVVEDDVMSAKAIELALDAFGMSVTTFPSAELALTDPRTDQADFFIADFRLPGKNGVQFLDAVQTRRQRPLRATLLTGDASDPAMSSRASNWRVCVKPVNVAALIAEIEGQTSGADSATGSICGDSLGMGRRCR